MMTTANRPNLAAEDFELFHDISTFIHATLELDEMLRRIFNRIKTAFNIEGASIALHDRDRQEFFFIHTVEMDTASAAGKLPRMRFQDHRGVAGWVLRHNRPAIVPDVRRENRFYEGIDLQQQFVTQNMICLPLRTRRGIIGVLYALNKLEGQFTQKEAWLLESLAATIAVAIENAKLYGELKNHAALLESENRRLKSAQKEFYKHQGIIGNGRAMQQVFHLVDKVLDTSTPVVLLGETGTGKELLARLVHFNSPRHDKPFIVENCAALAENLLESELFGHVRGAFTGATADKKGLFELADGGTVFLDEVGEIPPGTQVKLLRVLQDGKVRPVGSNRWIQVDFRLISATSRDLEAEVAAGRFRDDLFYRIHVFPIPLPPLRERKEDIPRLVDHFIRKHSKQMNRAVEGLSPSALERLMHYRWPGNVRELENEIERAVTLAGSERIIVEEHLSEKLSPENTRPPLSKTPGETLPAYTERIEKHWIVEALQETEGNRTRAAKLLGLSRQGLLKKIARYGIDA